VKANALILSLILTTAAHADKAADTRGNTFGTGNRDATQGGQAYSSQGLLTPEVAQGLWGVGKIPNTSHLADVLGSRRKDNFCGNEYKSLKEMQKKINPTPIPKPIQVLRDAVKQFHIPQKMLDKTVAVFLQNQTQIPNQRFITIFDHTQPSTAKRFVVIDLWNGTAKGYRSSHGSGSDPKRTGIAHSFGNDPRGNTNKSSIGCALANHKYRAKVTSQEPKGRWALSVLGFEDTNDRSCDRGVYMHAAPYVDYQTGVHGSNKAYARSPGRSWGCPAFTYHDRDEVFNQIDGGGLVCSWGG
jgi:hypothetical protein